MLFEPPIDEVVKAAGNAYIATIIIGARAKELQNKIPALLQASSSLAITYAAEEVKNGEVIGVSVKK
ncbi:MAG: hypothetical protein PHP83_02985 [Clostridia bacterium]|nr:hypothetical protein [Clostridia bacterium]